MGNVLSVLKRDILRLLKAPAALVVVVALLIIPSAYTWYNVKAFWDPYGNTNNMRVAVVNLDEGASSDLTGQINVGNSIVDTLKENYQLKWVFTDYDTAMADLRSGTDYAVFVIPKNFSSDMISITTGDVRNPQLDYYVNEKAGPVSPKVTDSGATTLEQTINSTFVSTVTDAVAKTLGEKYAEAQGTLRQAESAAEREVDQVASSISSARASVADLDESLNDTRSKLVEAKDVLESSRGSIVAVRDSLQNVSSISSSMQETLGSDVSVALEYVNQALARLTIILDVLKKAGFDSQADEALALVSDAAHEISGTALSESVAAMGDLSTTTAQLSATVDEQQRLIDQANALVDQMDSALATTQNAAHETDALLASLEKDLVTVRTDLTSLAQSTAIDELMKEYGLSADDIAEFMGSPTKLETVHLYELNAYGSAMAPLFMCLTFWVGAFCLLIIMKQEVDDKGIKGLTFTQRYMARFVLFSVLAVIQSAVCVTGVLALGVEVANIPGLYAASALASLAFLSIIYALSVLFQHVGKGVCIVLVFLQIPSATGLYPIEMTSAFYQAVSPLFPFTYGIAAIRECICGFYGTEYLEAMVALAVFFFLFLLMGIALRPVTSGVNLMVAKQVKESGMFMGEDVEVPQRTFKMAEVLAVLSDKDDYQERLIERYQRFQRNYPRFIKGGAIVGVAVPALLLFMHSFSVLGKVNLLTLWLIWLISWFVFMVVVENLRFRFETQMESLDKKKEQDNA